MKTDTPLSSEPIPIRVLKSGACPTLSNTATLGYDVGCSDQGAIYIRVHSNSGGGFFSKEWISLDSIQKVLEKYEHVTSFALRFLYVGKSINSPGFLLACLRNEGLVQLLAGSQNRYVKADPAKFMAEVKALMDAGIDVGAATPVAAIKKSKKE